MSSSEGAGAPARGFIGLPGESDVTSMFAGREGLTDDGPAAASAELPAPVAAPDRLARAGDAGDASGLAMGSSEKLAPPFLLVILARWFHDFGQRFRIR